MQFALLIFESPEAFAARNAKENDPYLGAWRAYYKALVEADIYVGGSPLQPPETGTTVRRDGIQILECRGDVCRRVQFRPGIHKHNKFVVTDFNLATAKVFTGSSNLSESGEKKNGDHLIMIQDPRVATSYAIQAILIFDHLHFAATMNAAKKPTQLVLQKPVAISKAKTTWFARYYEKDSQLERDRQLFSH